MSGFFWSLFLFSNARWNIARLSENKFIQSIQASKSEESIQDKIIWENLNIKFKDKFLSGKLYEKKFSELNLFKDEFPNTLL